METENRKIPFCHGTIFLIPPKLEHMLFSENGHTATSILSRSERLAPIRSIKHAQDNDMREAETLVRIMCAHKGTYNEYFQILGNAFILLLLDFIGIDEIDCVHSEAVEQIVSQINKNFSDPEFKVKTALIKSSYAEDYVRKIFKEETGMTPNQMLTETRLLHAQNIILYSNPERPISTIANESGFVDLAYFSKVFKKRFKHSPLEYKKKQKH